MKFTCLFINRLFAAFLLTAVIGLAGCANGPTVAQAGVLLPGGSQFYSYGVSQSKENFENIKKAQSNFGIFKQQRTWQDIRPMQAPARINLLQVYYPLSVRWELKDGRQFILENIDVAGIMREYFKTNNITLPYQLEGRPRDAVGDYDPAFVHEVRDDAVILKWLITTNKTPVKERLQPSGAANRWAFAREEYQVTVLKGNSTRGIDFEKWVEVNK